MTKNESRPSIQCDKCHKWIECNYYSGYSHRCSGRAEEIRRAAHKRLYSINSLQNRDARFFGMYNLADDLDSASVVYDPEANKLLRKDIEMNNRKRNQVERLVRSIDHAEERISYWERFNRYGGYDILIRLNISNREPEVVKYEDDIVKQIVKDHERNLEKWGKELDELLASKVDTSRRKIYKWWKKNK